MNRKRNIIIGMDWTSVLLVLVITLFGWLNIYGACYDFDQSSIANFQNRAGKQLMWMTVALITTSLILFIDEKYYDMTAYILYGISILILLITPLIAHDIKGSYSWITLGPVSIQPAEFAKCFTALAVAKYLGRYDYRYRNWKDLLIPLVLITIPMLIIMVPQRETGSALVFFAFFLVFYRFGMSGKVLLFALFSIVLFVVSVRFHHIPLSWANGMMDNMIFTGLIQLTACGLLIGSKKMKSIGLGVLAVTFLIYAILLIINCFKPIPFDNVNLIVICLTSAFLLIMAFRKRQTKLVLVALFSMLSIGLGHGFQYAFQQVLKPHQRTRIEVLLGVKDDPTGAGYNVNQSLISIGSGQLTGKGYLQGTQTKMHFVPEQDTDFIFCTVGEEWGFIGSFTLLILYMILIIHIIKIAERQHDHFSMIYAYCVASILLFHVTINIGMVLGLLPVIGIPLPFFSYGGSSILGFCLLMAILWRLDASRINKHQ